MELSRLTAFDSVDGLVAVVPLGSLEQHCRLPVGLDCMIAEKLSWLAAERAEATLGSSPLFAVAPPICYGFSPEWSLTPGTVSVPSDILIGFLKAVIRGLASWGFRVIAMVNGHGGNSCPARTAAAEESYKPQGPLVAVINYWEEADLTLGHACEVEEHIAMELGIISEPPSRDGCAVALPGGATGITAAPRRPAWMPGGEPKPVDTIVDAVAQRLAGLTRGPTTHRRRG